ncbi:hypothetical protein C8R45DRAFT_1192329 [Mycena sanguinolenta]|nr:hypothetical protein C8R45DRAFT_1192329 [Mycena sanguinolenta]
MVRDRRLNDEERGSKAKNAEGPAVLVLFPPLAGRARAVGGTRWARAKETEEGRQGGGGTGIYVHQRQGGRIPRQAASARAEIIRAHAGNYCWRWETAAAVPLEVKLGHAARRVCGELGGSPSHDGHHPHVTLALPPTRNRTIPILRMVCSSSSARPPPLSFLSLAPYSSEASRALEGWEELCPKAARLVDGCAAGSSSGGRTLDLEAVVVFVLAGAAVEARNARTTRREIEQGKWRARNSVLRVPRAKVDPIPAGAGARCKKEARDKRGRYPSYPHRARYPCHPPSSTGRVVRFITAVARKGIAGCGDVDIAQRLPQRRRFPEEGWEGKSSYFGVAAVADLSSSLIFHPSSFVSHPPRPRHVTPYHGWPSARCAQTATLREITSQRLRVNPSIQTQYRACSPRSARFARPPLARRAATIDGATKWVHLFARVTITLPSIIARPSSSPRTARRPGSLLAPSLRTRLHISQDYRNTSSTHFPVPSMPHYGRHIST